MFLYGFIFATFIDESLGPCHLGGSPSLNEPNSVLIRAHSLISLSLTAKTKFHYPSV
jgi:hypothetical protein